MPQHPIDMQTPIPHREAFIVTESLALTNTLNNLKVLQKSIRGMMK